MNCTIIPTQDIYRIDGAASFLIANLTKPSSDFAVSLAFRRPLEGHIALVYDFGEIIAWARTEVWMEQSVDETIDPPLELPWNTLEAFVNRSYRGRGLATFAAAGLASLSEFYDGDRTAAVFAPSMMMLARRVALQPTLFRKAGEKWVRA